MITIKILNNQHLTLLNGNIETINHVALFDSSALSGA